MTTLTIKTAKNFNIADSVAHELQSTVKKPAAYIAKDLVTGETQRWLGKRVCVRCRRACSSFKII